MSVTPIPTNGIMETVGAIREPDTLDPVALGFMCGLEIHQQLAADKLHSRLPSELYDFKLEDIQKEWNRASRKLRASEGEEGLGLRPLLLLAAADLAPAAPLLAIAAPSLPGLPGRSGSGRGRCPRSLGSTNTTLQHAQTRLIFFIKRI